MASGESGWMIYVFSGLSFILGWYFGAKYEERETKKKEKEREAQRHYEELINKPIDKSHKSS